MFTVSFRASVLYHCGALPRPQAMQDVFGLVWRAEPAAALVARDSSGRVIGYCFAPTRLSRLWLLAVCEGHLVKWAWRWLIGQYGFGLRPLGVIFSNKFFFLRSAFSPAKASDARILSVAVAPESRGCGLASALLAEALRYFAARNVRRARLEVRPDNLPAIRVYEKLGFSAGGMTRDLQGDWLIMYREMKQTQKGNSDV